SIDLYGLDPYPCRVDLNGCDYAMIPAAVSAARTAGIPLASIVPVYQAFGGGGWIDDTGGSYQLPTADEETQILSSWASVVPSPVFDYAYSWGTQNGDTALSNSPPELLQVFAGHNGLGGTPPAGAPDAGAQDTGAQDADAHDAGAQDATAPDSGISASGVPHIMVVFEENHSYSEIIGNPDARFIN